MWRIVGASVRGTSHHAAGIPCQDYSFSRRVFIRNAPAVVIGIADGAGSALASDIGAQLAVEYLVRNVPTGVRDVRAIDTPIAKEWIIAVREHLASYSARAGVPLEQLACTLLACVVSDEASVFIQVGDGTWVTNEDGRYRCATWPVKGEFANQTTFVTSARWEEAFQCERVFNPVSAVAGFTDGLQNLALQLSSRTAYDPFFELVFGALRSSRDDTRLQQALTEFLTSDAVNERTDDDKSLVLVCRDEVRLLCDVV